MSTQRYKHGSYEDYDQKDRDGRHHSRSKSRSKRYRRHDSRSRSRSRSIEQRKRRHRTSYSRSTSRSRSRGYSNRHDRHYTQRHKDSRSRSRSHSHNRSHSRRRSRSHSSTHGLQEGHRSRPNASADRGEKRHDYGNKRDFYKPQSHHDESNTSVTSSIAAETYLDDLPLPKQEAIGAYYNLHTDEPIDKERIHREMEEKLRQTLAKEGKVYPPPKPEASHPVFANDGSFLEIFKKMQEAQQQLHPPSTIATTVPNIPAAAASTSTSAYVTTSSVTRAAPPPPPPLVGRRRGGKILKTGVVAKPKAQTDTSTDPKDFWSLYLAEVNKYKNNTCESDERTRPLVK